MDDPHTDTVHAGRCFDEGDGCKATTWSFDLWTGEFQERRWTPNRGQKTSASSGLQRRRPRRRRSEMAHQPGDYQGDQINPKLHYIPKDEFLEFYTENYQHKPMADCLHVHGNEGRGTRWTVPNRWSFTTPRAQGHHRTDRGFLSDDHAFARTAYCKLFSLEEHAEADRFCGAGDRTNRPGDPSSIDQKAEHRERSRGDVR